VQKLSTITTIHIKSNTQFRESWINIFTPASRMVYNPLRGIELISVTTSSGEVLQNYIPSLIIPLLPPLERRILREGGIINGEGNFTMHVCPKRAKISLCLPYCALTRLVDCDLYIVIYYPDSDMTHRVNCTCSYSGKKKDPPTQRYVYLNYYTSIPGWSVEIEDHTCGYILFYSNDRTIERAMENRLAIYTYLETSSLKLYGNHTVDKILLYLHSDIEFTGNAYKTINKNVPVCEYSLHSIQSILPPSCYKNPVVYMHLILICVGERTDF